MKKIITILIIIAVAGFVIRQYIKYRVAPDIDLGALHLFDMQGKPVSLSAYKGKPLFINFYATWCPPCNREMPELELLKQTLQKDSIVFLAISDENPALVQGFIHRSSSSFTFLQTSEHRDQYGINTIPTTYIFSSKGAQLFHTIGVEDWNNPKMVNKIHKMVTEGLTPEP